MSKFHSSNHAKTHSRSALSLFLLRGHCQLGRFTRVPPNLCHLRGYGYGLEHSLTPFHFALPYIGQHTATQDTLDLVTLQSAIHRKSGPVPTGRSIGTGGRARNSSIPAHHGHSGISLLLLQKQLPPSKITRASFDTRRGRVDACMVNVKHSASAIQVIRPRVLGSHDSVKLSGADEMLLPRTGPGSGSYHLLVQESSTGTF